MKSNLIFFALFAPLAIAQNVVPERSLAEMENDVVKLAGNPDFDYRLGMALLKADRAGEALFAFERVIISAPGNIDARLKIAQISVERNAVTYAKEVLAPLGTMSLSNQQQQQLDSLRTALAKTASDTGAGGVTLRGYVMAGTGRDSNVTGGPNLQTILLPGTGTATQPATPTTLGTAAQDADRVSLIESGASFRQQVNEDTWFAGGGSARQGFNASRKDVRDGYINVDFGLIRKSGDDYYGVTFLAQDYRVAAKTYRNSRGLRAHWTHPLSETSVLGAYAQFIDFDYPSNAIDNSARTTVGINGESSLGASALARYGFYVGKDQVRDNSRPHFGFRLYGMQLGANFRATENLTLSASTSIEQRTHRATDALHRILRVDTQRGVGFAADYKFSPNWHLIPQYTYNNNASTTGLYAYTRGTFLLQLKWDFDNEKN